MTMRDRVIAALENCTDAEKCKDCPWAPCEEFDYPHSDYPDDLIKKALELLKAEPKRGKWQPNPYDRNWSFCSVCGAGTELVVYEDGGTKFYNYGFCPWCGAKMEADT